MNSEKKVLITSALKLLQERDPEWKKAKMCRQFKILFQGWRQKELRHKKHTAGFYTLSWNRGWLPQADFIRWREYACSLEQPKKK